MQEEAREATTRCPRCGGPIVWRRRGDGGLVRAVEALIGLDALEVAGQGCPCALGDDEWDDLADAANAVPDEEG